MKISILTSTYNRGKRLEILYNSLIINNNSSIKFEWLIMDDGSTDKTKLYVDNFIKQNIIDIKYYYEENSGKMTAINNLMNYVNGDICFTCDSDDYLTVNCIDTIKGYADLLLNDDSIYALCFLKKNERGKISGLKFHDNIYRSDMFTLYFKEEIGGEKILVYRTDVRKKYSHQIEANEKFITEDRMYHKMDLDNDIICINKVIEIGDYNKDGYALNQEDIFEKYPKGYFQYFKELLEMNLKGVKLNKKIYIYKHYILFAYLSKAKRPIRQVDGLKNKILILFCWPLFYLLSVLKYHKKKDRKVKN